MDHRRVLRDSPRDVAFVPLMAGLFAENLIAVEDLTPIGHAPDAGAWHPLRAGR
jgi:hypothetical protein